MNPLKIVIGAIQIGTGIATGNPVTVVKGTVKVITNSIPADVDWVEVADT